MVILSQITNRAINKIVNENANEQYRWMEFLMLEVITNPKDNGQHQTEIISLVR